MSTDKLRAAVLHVIENCPADRLGAVKLHKVLYYADMMTYLDTGQPLTGAEYRKRPFGPTCDAALRVLRDLEREGSITVSEVDYFGYRKREFHLARHPNGTNQLSERDKDALAKMIEFVCFDNSAKSISELSHQLPWEMVDLGEVMPYGDALHLIPSDVSIETLEWAEAEGEAVDSKRREAKTKGPVESRDSADLRNRMVAALG